MNRDVYIVLIVNSWIVFNLTEGWLSHSLSLDKVHSIQEEGQVFKMPKSANGNNLTRPNRHSGGKRKRFSTQCKLLVFMVLLFPKYRENNLIRY